MKKFLIRKFSQGYLNKYSKVLTNGKNNMENYNITYDLGDTNFIKYVMAKSLNNNKTNPLMENIL